MDNFDKQQYEERYLNRFIKFGNDPRTLGWNGGASKINKRFEVLSSVGNINSCSLLDVGCGFGDLYGYLSKDFSFDYTGIDILPFLVEEAKKTYTLNNESNAPCFMEMDLLQQNIFSSNSIDYVVASGVFNAQLANTSMETHISNYVSKMFDICKIGVAVDFMTDYVDFKNEISHHTSPEWVFSFAKKLSKRVCLRHDYFPFEFCLYIYKNDSYSDNTVFEEAIQ